MNRLIELNKIPNLIKKNHMTDKRGYIQENLSSRQVVTIPNNILSLLPEYYQIIYNDSDRDINECLLPEYICSTNTFILSDDCLKHLRENNPPLIDIIIYGTEDSLFDEYINKNVILPNINIKTKNVKLEYILFEETKYNIITIEDSNYYILNINIPLEIYSKIELSEKIFSYDINTNKFYENEFMFSDDIDSDMFRIYRDEMRNQKNMEIYMLMNNGAISFPEGDNANIFYSKYFQLPYIPAALVVSDGIISFNASNKKSYINELNELCKPYFIFD